MKTIKKILISILLILQFYVIYRKFIFNFSPSAFSNKIKQTENANLHVRETIIEEIEDKGDQVQEQQEENDEEEEKKSNVHESNVNIYEFDDNGVLLKNWETIVESFKIPSWSNNKVSVPSPESLLKNETFLEMDKTARSVLEIFTVFWGEEVFFRNF